MNSHRDFITSPITEILIDVVSANVGIGNGIETYPLGDYVMQSVFLKMTGFQEQKMKCICWELATYDYEYRYKRYTLKPLGECSTYDEKKIIYKDLIEQIKKHVPDFDVSVFLEKQIIKMNTFSEIQDIFSETNFSTWSQKSFTEFTSNTSLIQSIHFGNVNNLLENVLQDKYSLLYNHRNRCAHNTLSYQQNLPTLKTILNDNYRYDNYFVRFALLILLDKIFVKLYGKYIEILDIN
ncbi:MAG: hypothetical protein IPP56_14775 [Bacteroidetes bacterium]|nr:hypothetical protein [Bacteroidota bacterium]MBK9672815.1 hypothetical protein [Bacteroidota bacterium]MBK9800926.1 hypothetical protein [Bacteroidota bacterium]MBP6412479.1 hypothetical protein [Bacteroidia bacterium]